ncbi:MAG: DUF3379 family protein [Xanthomonadales bacterium]|nr:DUF3379 family protein [Xanthomonadales bacterium]
MNLDELEKQLLIEPDSQDPEFLAAKTSTLEHARAVKASEQFEKDLAEALRLPVGEDNAERVLTAIFDDQSDGPPARRWGLLAMAASLVAAVGLAFFLIQPEQPSDIRTAFVEHLRHPEPQALASDTAVAEGRALEALALMGATGLPREAAVTFAYPCPIGGVKGMHLVVTDRQRRKTTLMFMPERSLASPEEFVVDGMPARVFNTPSGAAAAFAHSGELPQELLRELFGADRLALAFNG